MKTKTINFFKLALLICLFIPAIVYANEDKYTIENFKSSSEDFGPLIKPGVFSKFYFEEYNSDNESVINEYNWNGDYTEFDGNTEDLFIHDSLYTEYDNGQLYLDLPDDQTLEIEESEITQGAYYYYVLNGNNKESISSSIYLSSSKGESIGSFNNYDEYSYNNSKVYELTRITDEESDPAEPKYDYVTETGKVLLSTTDNGYKIIGVTGSIITLFNGSTAYILKYINQKFVEYKTIQVATIKTLLSKNDLTGLKLKYEFAIEDEDYYSIILENRTYFVNDSFNKVIYESAIFESDVSNYYAVEYNDEIYVFLDFNNYYENIQSNIESNAIASYTVHTEVFNLDGESLFDDTNWSNIYFAYYGAMFGITKDNDKYIMKFLSLDGELLYSKDYTDLLDDFNPYTVYGYVYLPDHDTDVIETGKYIIGYYYYDDYDELYIRELKFLTVNEHYVIDGKDQTYAGKDLVIRFNGNIDDFENLLINDKIVSTNNYTKESGSVIVTINSSYLKTLGEGTYTVKAVFTGGGFADTSIVIPVINPKTGDSITNSIILGTISLISLLGIVLHTSKKRYN